MDACMQEVRSGNFKSYARWLAVIDVLLEMAVPILCLVTNRTLPVITFVLLILFSVLAGVLELPMCCGCLQCCRFLGDKMKVFKNFMLRALFYACVSATLLAVSAAIESENNPAGWYFGIANGINCFFYMIASMKGEVAGDEAADEAVVRDKAREALRNQALTAAGGAAKDPKVQAAAAEAMQDPENQKLVGDAVKSNPGLAAAALKAARV
mmetsp:Transcript_39135/g.76503  ORF Transcript_39135/g.76503 Transcript_39135/m.76503 type:complete len:211 (-) Transcript_39135:24-656(-)|eukprot:CAMPEP_0173389356 /NCGR_PEP_ID=MMETSP1356-20130122/11456_1 /TAXON_ID=77927 ORGANISM="Hemiselmis virescens, Strain PCC157" /NCGR_SAMPLE_ID=MMETSP1356 /ASSEMBLY_ACC=CAM_ASM_000847 /LENGTH=210 /DNA_ID=CAMNT_0014346487 /DNA_START=305 /DNA_END=937 /DNA_ORIENTATION=+